MFGQPDYMNGYQQPMNPQPMQDQLMQLRQQCQPPQMQPFQAPQMQPRQPQSNMIWVQGETGAKSYLIAAGNTVPLWDSENQTIYIKTVDASGVPSMRVLDYTERAQTPTVPAQAVKSPEEEFVTRKEFEELAAKLAALTVKPVRKVVKEVAEDG